MDGPLVVLMVVYLVYPLLWTYQRFFQKVGDASPELGELCRSRPVLAVLRLTSDSSGDVVEHLRTVLGRRAELVVTLGKWPWTRHVIRVDIVTAADVVQVVAASCRVRRVREGRVVPLTGLLLGALERFRIDPDECWLCPEAYGPVLGGPAPHGWRLLPGSALRFPLEPWERPPSFTGNGSGSLQS